MKLRCGLADFLLKAVAGINVLVEGGGLYFQFLETILRCDDTL